MAKNSSKNQVISAEKPRVYAFVRVSTFNQLTENQEFGILKFADERKLTITEWVREKASGTKKSEDRKLGPLIDRFRSGDILIIGEVSRLGRNSLDTFIALQRIIEKNVRLFSIKEGYEFKDDLASEMMAFCFSVAARIERDRISNRSSEAAQMRKAKGMKLGRPVGSRNVNLKLNGKEDEVKQLVSKKVPASVIARMLEVDRRTVKKFVDSYT
ncbi:recombinase family protein [Runella sp.]|uniref:recombinase family protein n=1 Tax=Runella sp. TaxID=1960881 RepID=UPI003D0C869D